jgi:hypothetical protein
MLKVSKTATATVWRQNLYAKDSELSNKRARLLKLGALDGRRTRLLSEVSTISEQIRVLKREVAEDLAAFRRWPRSYRLWEQTLGVGDAVGVKDLNAVRPIAQFSGNARSWPTWTRRYVANVA